jgi:prepilin-type processing-associated H-X9-DG protein
VLVLPYIEQDALYKEFHLDEPWDSDHNKKLLEKMPPLFAGTDEAARKEHETHYQTFVGKGAIFDGKKGVKITDITDGTSNTIMLVEAKKAVPWTKPEDVPFDAGKLVPKLGGLFDGIFNAAFADGSVRSLPLTIKEEKLRALITRNGGEVIDPGK